RRGHRGRQRLRGRERSAGGDSTGPRDRRSHPGPRDANDAAWRRRRLRLRPATRAIALASLLLGPALSTATPAPDLAQPAAAVVGTAAGRPAGRTIAVPSGGDLQSALAASRPGDAVELEPGAVYRGPFTLPKKSGAGWIVVRTAGEAGAAAAGTRVDPGQ